MRRIIVHGLAVLTGFAFAVMALPMAATAVEPASVPPTVTSGQPFEVLVVGDDYEEYEVVAAKQGTTLTATFPVTAAQRTITIDGDQVRAHVAVVALPVGGDWSFAGRRMWDDRLGSSTIWTSCDPAPLRSEIALNHTWVSYGSPARLTVTLRSPDGTPLSGAIVELVAIDSYNPRRLPMAKQLLRTDAAGSATASLTHRNPGESPDEAGKWAIRVRGLADHGAYMTPSVTTRWRPVLNGGLLGSGSRSGKVRLVAGTRYQFIQAWEPAAGRNQGVFTLKSASGRTVFSAALDRYADRSFTVSRTGYYAWRMRLTKGYYVGWTIW